VYGGQVVPHFLPCGKARQNAMAVRPPSAEPRGAPSIGIGVVMDTVTPGGEQPFSGLEDPSVVATALRRRTNLVVPDSAAGSE
jgi:hypothetical protein